MGKIMCVYNVKAAYKQVYNHVNSLHNGRVVYSAFCSGWILYFLLKFY